MTWIKICGITNTDDAQMAVEAGADALGFVFYEKSPRCVSVEEARRAAAAVPRGVEKVGVFVNQDSGAVANIAAQTELTGVQVYLPLSGSDGIPSSLKRYPVLHANEVSNGIGEGNFPDPAIAAVFLDSGNRENPGGTGKTFDWQKALPLAESIRQRGFRLVVAGGLTPANVAEAIGILRPWGVDVSSGVEAEPGKKDPAKVRDFIAAVRQAGK